MATLSLVTMVASRADEVSGASLPKLLEWMEEHHPELVASRLEYAAAQARVYPAGALPDPSLAIEWRDIQTGTQNTRYQIRQTVPLWGKQDLRSAVVRSGADAQAARLTQTRLSLRARLKTAYWQWVAARETQASLAWVKRSLTETEQFARARYEAGRANQAEVLRAQVELAALENEGAEAALDERRALARINALLQRSSDAMLANPADLAKPAALPSLAVLEERLRQGSPILVEAVAGIAASERNVVLVRANRWPDLTIGVAPIQTGGRFAAWDLMLEVNLPLQQEARRQQEREAASLKGTADARRQALEASLIGDLGEAYATHEMAVHHTHVLHTRLLPQAELSWRAAVSAYASGRGDLAAVLEAERLMRRLRIDFVRSEREVRQQRIAIELLIGGGL